MNELVTSLANWGVTLSQSQKNGFIAHVQAIINTNAATIDADCATDLGNFPEPPHTRHT